MSKLSSRPSLLLLLAPEGTSGLSYGFSCRLYFPTKVVVGSKQAGREWVDNSSQPLIVPPTVLIDL